MKNRTVPYDLAIVGGGIIGLATAMEWVTRFPGSKVVVLEKEPVVAAHQTGHNSGVIHSGLYYRPGSLKAKTCVAGAKLMVEFCQAHRIPYEMCGKLVVATEASEVPALERLYQRGLANGVSGLSLIGRDEMREVEPHARGVRALHVESAGIVDYAAVARAFADLIRRGGGEIRTSVRVTRLLRRERCWLLATTAGEIRAAQLITCGGLHADRMAAMAGHASGLRIVPFRGDYYELAEERRFLVKGMIYPVPDPSLPFLGVHVTRTINGSVHVGPNAVLALKREGYRKRDINPSDLLALVSHSGFWKMARKHWAVGMSELHRSLSKRAFVRAVQRLVPEVTLADLVPGGSGVRAQAVGDDGALVDDFDIVQHEQAVHVRNVPSPAATASIRLGQVITDMAAPHLTRATKFDKV